MQTTGSVNDPLETARLIERLDDDVKYFLMELGLRSPNYPFHYASDMLRPNMGVITNIGHSHIENFENKANLESAITISKNAANVHVSGTNLKFNQGSVFTVRDLLCAMLFKSSFEALYAICEHCFETPKNLLNRINKTIKELGLNDASISCFKTGK